MKTRGTYRLLRVLQPWPRYVRGQCQLVSKCVDQGDNQRDKTPYFKGIEQSLLRHWMETFRTSAVVSQPDIVTVDRRVGKFKGVCMILTTETKCAYPILLQPSLHPR